MKTDRFAKRRALLRRRHKCTRCGTGTPKPGCRTCPDCLAVITEKRTIVDDPEARERRRLKMARRLEMIRAAMTKVEGRAMVTL